MCYNAVNKELAAVLTDFQRFKIYTLEIGCFYYRDNRAEYTITKREGFPVLLVAKH